MGSEEDKNEQNNIKPKTKLEKPNMTLVIR